MAGLKASPPDLRIVVTGMVADDETIMKTVAGVAKSYIDDLAGLKANLPASTLLELQLQRDRRLKSAFSVLTVSGNDTHVSAQRFRLSEQY